MRHYLINRIYVCEPSHTQTHALDIWCILPSCFPFSFYCSSQQLKETERERWRTVCSPCGHSSVATCLHYCSNCLLTIFISASNGNGVHIARDEVTVLFAIQRSYGIYPFQFGINSGKKCWKASEYWKQVGSYKYRWYLSEGLSGSSC